MFPAAQGETNVAPCTGEETEAQKDWVSHQPLVGTGSLCPVRALRLGLSRAGAEGPLGAPQGLPLLWHLTDWRAGSGEVEPPSCIQACSGLPYPRFSCPCTQGPEGRAGQIPAGEGGSWGGPVFHLHPRAWPCWRPSFPGILFLGLIPPALAALRATFLMASLLCLFCPLVWPPLTFMGLSVGTAHLHFTTGVQLSA